MRTLQIGTAAALVVALAQGAQAQTFKATATLQGGEEVPALLTGAVGTAEVIVDGDSRELNVTLRIFNLPTGSTAGHIHVGSRGVAGPVVLDFPIPGGRTGDVELSFRASRSSLRPRPELGILTIDDLIQTIAAGGAYVNIHTSQNPAGEIRGQLTVSQ